MHNAGRAQNKPNHIGDKTVIDGTAETPEKPGFKVTFERSDTRGPRDKLTTATTASETVLLDTSAPPEPAPPSAYGNEAGLPVDGDTSAGVPALVESAEGETPWRKSTSDTPTTMQLLHTPMLALAAVLAMLAAGWSYLKLNETQMALEASTRSLATVTAERSVLMKEKTQLTAQIDAAAAGQASSAQARAAAENALAATKARLTAMEKAVGDIKSALAAAMTAASITAAPAGAAPASEQAAPQ